MELPFPAQTPDRPLLQPEAKDNNKNENVPQYSTTSCQHRDGGGAYSRQAAHTFVLYSQSILKKSSNVWGKGPWVAM